MAAAGAWPTSPVGSKVGTAGEGGGATANDPPRVDADRPVVHCTARAERRVGNKRGTWGGGGAPGCCGCARLPLRRRPRGALCTTANQTGVQEAGRSRRLGTPPTRGLTRRATSRLMRPPLPRSPVARPTPGNWEGRRGARRAGANRVRSRRHSSPTPGIHPTTGVAACTRARAQAQRRPAAVPSTSPPLDHLWQVWPRRAGVGMPQSPVHLPPHARACGREETPTAPVAPPTHHGEC